MILGPQSAIAQETYAEESKRYARTAIKVLLTFSARSRGIVVSAAQQGGSVWLARTATNLSAMPISTLETALIDAQSSSVGVEGAGGGIMSWQKIWTGEEAVKDSKNSVAFAQVFGRVSNAESLGARFHSGNGP